MPQPLSVLSIKHGSLNHFPETHRETLEDQCHCLMTAATEQVVVSQVFPRPPMETIFKDSCFVSGSGIAKDLKIQLLTMKTNQSVYLFLLANSLKTSTVYFIIKGN